jgi:hypothetical protein
MFARVTIAEGDASRMDEGIKNLTENVIPRAKQLPGLNGGWWMADREAGKVISITLWDSEESLRASETVAAGLRAQAAEAFDATFTVYSGEVVGQV